MVIKNKIVFRKEGYKTFVYGKDNIHSGRYKEGDIIIVIWEDSYNTCYRLSKSLHPYYICSGNTIEETWNKYKNREDK